jgi:hypothetical protein
MDDAAPTEPTDKSNPPTIIMRSMPHETTPIIEFCWRIFHRFSGRRNVGDRTVNEATRTTKTREIP